MLKKYLQKILYSEGVRPLPTSIMIIIYFLMLVNSMTVTMVYSFLPKMVKMFGASEVILIVFIPKYLSVFLPPADGLGLGLALRLTIDASAAAAAAAAATAAAAAAGGGAAVPSSIHSYTIVHVSIFSVTAAASALVTQLLPLLSTAVAHHSIASKGN